MSVSLENLEKAASLVRAAYRRSAYQWQDHPSRSILLDAPHLLKEGRGFLRVDGSRGSVSASVFDAPTTAVDLHLRLATTHHPIVGKVD